MRKHVLLTLFFTVFFLPVAIQAAVMNQSEITMELDADFWIEPGGRRVWYGFTAEVIYIQVRVETGDGLEFFICDGDDYADWSDGLTATLYEHRETMTSLSMVYEVPRLDDWRVVFNNEDDESQHLIGWVGLDPPPLLTIDSAFLLGGGISLVIAVVGIFWYRKSQKKKPPRHSEPPEMIQ